MKTPGIEDLEAFLQIFQASDYTELHFEAGGFEVLLSDDPNAAQTAASSAPASGGAVAPAVATTLASATSAAAPPADAELQGLVALTAPSLGHFYRSPKPGALPFVDLGQIVDVHDTVCVIEVMKLFTLLEAGRKGIVRKICVEDGELVEFGQALIYLEAVE